MTAVNQAVQQTRQWLQTIVVGLNLCPFAAPVLKAGGVHIAVCEAETDQAIIAAVLQQLDQLQQTDESTIATSLLVLSNGLREFSDYWSLVEVANELLQQAGLQGVIQIASFHPDYCFDGVPEDDVSHYTNRSPYPMLHFIREAQLTRALENYPQPELIPEKNIRKLQAMGKPALLKLLAMESL